MGLGGDFLPGRNLQTDSDAGHLMATAAQKSGLGLKATYDTSLQLSFRRTSIVLHIKSQRGSN